MYDCSDITKKPQKTKKKHYVQSLFLQFNRNRFPQIKHFLLTFQIIL